MSKPVVTVYFRADEEIDDQELFNDVDDLIPEFDAFLEDQSDEVVVYGLTFSSAAVLKEMDPIAYRQELLDWQDSYYSEETISQKEWDRYKETGKIPKSLR